MSWIQVWTCRAAGVAVVAFLLPALVVGQETVPAPAKAFTPRTVLAIYADLQGASQSGIWKTFEAKLPPPAEGLKALPGVQGQAAALLAGLPELKPGDLAELAIAFEGEKAFENLQREQFDPDFGFVAALRLGRPLEVGPFIQQVLEQVEQEKPGLRARLEQTRSRVGAAEVFDLPDELFGPDKPPFPLSAAVGPGADGAVLAVGKAESLRRFLSGKTDGTLPGKLSATLARRGQIWLYVPVKADMVRNLQGGGAGNPMMAGVTQGVEKVREVGLGLDFGASAVGLELAVGCTDGAAAKELNDGLQQFLGMMQMMATQSPGTTPPALGKLKGSVDGTTFRVATEFTARDLDVAMKQAGTGAGAGRTASARSPAGAAPEVEPMPVQGPAPVDVEFLELLPGDEQALRFTRLRINNRSAKAVREIRVTFTYFDGAGRRLGQWTRRHTDPSAAQLAPAAASREVRCPTFHVPSTTRKVTLTLHEVVFDDGAKWLKPSPM